MVRLRGSAQIFGARFVRGRCTARAGPKRKKKKREKRKRERKKDESKRRKRNDSIERRRGEWKMEKGGANVRLARRKRTGDGKGGERTDERTKERTNERTNVARPRYGSYDWRYQSTGALCSGIIWRAVERARSQIPRSDNGPCKAPLGYISTEPQLVHRVSRAKLPARLSSSSSSPPEGRRGGSSKPLYIFLTRDTLSLGTR